MSNNYDHVVILDDQVKGASHNEVEIRPDILFERMAEIMKASNAVAACLADGRGMIIVDLAYSNPFNRNVSDPNEPTFEGMGLVLCFENVRLVPAANAILPCEVDVNRPNVRKVRL
jgi:hypothetical protein